MRYFYTYRLSSTGEWLQHYGESETAGKAMEAALTKSGYIDAFSVYSFDQKTGIITHVFRSLVKSNI